MEYEGRAEKNDEASDVVWPCMARGSGWYGSIS